MTDKPADANQEDVHRTFFREVLQNIRQIMAENYGMKEVSIRPITSSSSRLSIPIKITGTNEKGKKIHYFGKILGSSDIFSARSIEFFKNVYLRINAQDPIFGSSKTAEDMARYQYEMLQNIYNSGIPTAKPYGYHWICGMLWLLVAEFLDVKPVSAFNEIDPGRVDMIFRYLKKMHKMKLFHGDLKPDNIMVEDNIYILDVGYFREGAPAAKKQAYDIACLICSFLECFPVEEILKIAQKHYSRWHLRAAANYIGLVQRRPDIHFTDQTKNKLLRILKG
jgi:tRNA A-37 threonylcarbamoyl transferase component Bud32